MDKKKRIRSKKEDIFKNERDNFINELNILIGINENNNTAIFNEINNNITLQEFIDNNENNIKKYFRCSSWNYFIQGRNQKRELATLIKNIYKSQKYTIFSKSFNLKQNNKTVKATKMFFFKDGDVIHFSD